MDRKRVKELIAEYHEFKIAFSQRDFASYGWKNERVYNDAITSLGYFIYQIEGVSWIDESNFRTRDTSGYKRYPIEDMEKVLRKARKLRNFE